MLTSDLIFLLETEIETMDSKKAATKVENVDKSETEAKNIRKRETNIRIILYLCNLIRASEQLRQKKPYAMAFPFHLWPKPQLLTLY